MLSTSSALLMIDIVNDGELSEDDLSWLELNLAKIETAARICDAGDLCINIVSVTDMQSLNRDYRGIDTPTDVLAFPVVCDDFPQPEPILGDIALCPTQIRQNAEVQGSDFRVELLYALTHGILHLLGWNHDTDETDKTMNQKTIELLTQCGVEVSDLG